MFHRNLSRLAAISITLLGVNLAHATTPTVPAQQQFFERISDLCGQAFEGKVSVDNAPSDSFTNKKLVMHVRQCTPNQLHVPFHVGDDASRTWVITKTGSGLNLKHDHRHRDGSEDAVTQYGGHTVDAGWPQVQSFPADSYTQQLFVDQGLPQSIGNTWQMFIYPDTFSYRLIRQGREFRVDFDLREPIPAPAAPWGFQD